MPDKKTKSQSPDNETVDTDEKNTTQIDPRLLSALICPKTHTPLSYDHDTQELISKKAGLAYPIRDGVPIMLIEEARSLK